MYDNIIIIPYRNREKQLNYFMENVVPLVKKFLQNTKIVIVEQEQGKIFNKGVLMNIGFKTYENKTKYFIQNDIDLTPKKKSLEEYYSRDIDENEVLAILTSPCDVYGGIIKICNGAIHKINGYPNDIWGWGCEDKALQNRGEFYNLRKTTIFIHNDKKRDDAYFKTFDDTDDRVLTHHTKNHNIHFHNFLNLNYNEKNDSINNNGLNTLKYTIIEKKNLDSIVELIKVDF